jgi:hypothetical protein
MGKLDSGIIFSLCLLPAENRLDGAAAINDSLVLPWSTSRKGGKERGSRYLHVPVSRMYPAPWSRWVRYTFDLFFQVFTLYIYSETIN